MGPSAFAIVDNVAAASIAPANHRVGIIRRLRRLHRFRLSVRLSELVNETVTGGTLYLLGWQSSSLRHNLHNLRILFSDLGTPWLIDGAWFIGGFLRRLGIGELVG